MLAANMMDIEHKFHIQTLYMHMFTHIYIHCTSTYSHIFTYAINIQTQIVLDEDTRFDESAAKSVKARIERTTLRNVSDITAVIGASGAFIEIQYVWVGGYLYPLCVCECIPVCVCECMPVCVCECMPVCVYECMPVCILAYVCVYTYHTWTSHRVPTHKHTSTHKNT